MSDLGLRYPPRSTIDERDHGARILLLAKDCAGIDPDLLERAAEDWAKRQPFLPRACELRELATNIGKITRVDRILPAPQREPVAKPFAPPLSDDEIRKLPRTFIDMGIKLGEIAPERAARLRPQTGA